MKANYKVRKMFAFRDYVSDLNTSFPISVAQSTDKETSYSLAMVIHCIVQSGIEFPCSILSSTSVCRGLVSLVSG